MTIPLIPRQYDLARRHALALGAGFVLLLLKHWRLAVALLVGSAAVVLLFANLKAMRRG